MPNNVKVLWFFEAGGAGWSEVGWTQINTMKPSDAATLAYNLGQLRLVLCGQNVKLKYIRCSLEGSPRVVDIQETDLNTIVGSASGFVSPAVARSVINPYISLQCRGQSDDEQYHRLFDIRGLPQTLLPTDILPFTPPAAWVTAFNTWKVQYATNPANWFIRAFDKSQTQWDVLNITNPSANVTQVQTSLANGFAVGDKIHLFRSIGVFPPTGNFVVNTIIDATTFQFKFQPKTGFIYTSGGKVRKNVYTYQPQNSLMYETIQHRKAGRPFGQPVGRRRAR